MPISIRIAAAAATVLLAAAAASQDAVLPAGPGKDAVERICSSCHEMDVTIGMRRTKVGWQTTVDAMTERGATGTPEELTMVVEYLTENVGKVNVNSASAAEMQHFLGISEKEAQAIVEYRDKTAKFKDLEQLKKVPGIDAGKLEAKKQLIAFND